jgi:methyl-accepting chemotaxis protein
MSGQASQLQELMAFFTVGEIVGAAPRTSNIKPFKPAIKKTVTPVYNEAEFVKF